MKKKVLFSGIFLIGTLFAFSTAVLAVTPPEENRNTRHPQISPMVKQNHPQRSTGAAERQPKMNPHPPQAVAPYNSNSRIATPSGALRMPVRARGYSGVVTAILPDSKAFTLSTKEGPVAIGTDSQTKFVKGNDKEHVRATFDDLQVNDHVSVVVNSDRADSLKARVVVILPHQKAEIKRRGVYGVVERKSKSGSTTLLTLQNPKNERGHEVVINEQTQITSKGQKDLTADDIQIGNRVAAAGVVEGVNKIIAKHLHIIPGQGRGLSNTVPSSTSSQRHPSPSQMSRPTPHGGNAILSP